MTPDLEQLADEAIAPSHLEMWRQASMTPVEAGAR
jgi:hypothetical protein